MSLKHNVALPSVGVKTLLHSQSLYPLRPQVFRGSGDLFQGGKKGGALRHHLQEDQPEEGTGDAHGVGNQPIGAHPGHSQKRLQTHRGHPGFSGLHASADAPAVRHHPGEILPPCKM